MPDEVVMYCVVNRDCPMDKGKVAAQVAHSACKASHAASTGKRAEDWLRWWRGSYTKIVLKASGYEMTQILLKHPEICYATYDEGRTQIDKGSLTTIAIVPMPKSEVPEDIRALKLL